jgi:hypothetical protein
LSDTVGVDASPYTPGAGHRPPVLAGRDDIIRVWENTLNDVAASGRSHGRDIILQAPRGVGKTATVLEFEDLSSQRDFEVISVQAARGNSTLVDSILRRASARAEEGPGPWQRARRAFDRIASINVSVMGNGGGIETRVSPQPVSHPVSPEDLADAVATLDAEIRKDHPHGGVLLTVDEIQASAPADLTLLAAALQDLNRHHPDAHVMFAASGLPNTEDVLSAAGVTHPDRLFDVYPLGLLLHPDDARYAIVEPSRERGVIWEPEAADLIVQATSGYPAHLQLLADETWRLAIGPGLISITDAQHGIRQGASTLERRSLGPRFDRMSDRQREFVTGLAALGGYATMSDVAITLGRERGSLSDTRDVLLTEGDVYSPRRGEIALTAPLFAPYLLANYEESRSMTGTALLPLEEMHRSVEAIDIARQVRGIQSRLGARDISTSAPSNTSRPALPRSRDNTQQQRRRS